jgi:alanine dehydrogenase
MVIGVPKEIKTEEKRVAITPAGVTAFVSRGHKVLVQRGAGMGSAILDKHYAAAGAELVDDTKKIWQDAQMILKVKEPLETEYSYLQEGQVLFTYLHLAANRPLTEVMLALKVIGIGYETIQLNDGSLPLLAPMSEVAGRLAVQVGAQCLEVKNGGRGILLSGVSGVPPAKVVIIGAGCGWHQCLPCSRWYWSPGEHPGHQSFPTVLCERYHAESRHYRHVQQCQH